MKRVALYTRVSTDDQTTDNQRRELEAAAERHGWQIVETFTDEGISGAKGKDKRPGFAALHAGIARRDFDIVAAWSVDRLGRSLQDLVGLLSDLNAQGLDLYLHKQGLDTSTPSGRMMFGLLSVFSEFERAMIVERVRAGMARARERGTRSGKPIGRPPVPEATKSKIIALRSQGHGIKRIAREARCGIGTVIKIVQPVAPEPAQRGDIRWRVAQGAQVIAGGFPTRDAATLAARRLAEAKGSLPYAVEPEPAP
jgi:DNA invertase Pin-like site-specific DNA recombinase